MTLKYTLLLWQISVHSVFSRYLDSRFFSILGWMADVRKGGKHVKIGENSEMKTREIDMKSSSRKTKREPFSV